MARTVVKVNNCSTVALFNHLIQKKKSYLSSLISRTIELKPSNQEFTISAAEELKCHLFPSISSGKRAGLQ